MPKFLTLKESYEKCLSDGSIIPQNQVDILKIESMLEIIKEDIESAKELKSKKETPWNTIYKLYYDALHTLAEALLRFDRIKSSNHQCLFSYLCTKHTELELDWSFFEKVRTKRNGINYYGSKATSKDWKEIEVQLYLYIKALTEAVEQKIRNFKHENF
ncbi:MAG: hypothetical protein NTZ02_00600 [Candidatus Woesearchaeota archaeon]|nr:hypothetical protein [Candidatus Woesearchaeota archaeon]